MSNRYLQNTSYAKSGSLSKPIGAQSYPAIAYQTLKENPIISIGLGMLAISIAIGGPFGSSNDLIRIIDAKTGAKVYSEPDRIWYSFQMNGAGVEILSFPAKKANADNLVLWSSYKDAEKAAKETARQLRETSLDKEWDELKFNHFGP